MTIRPCVAVRRGRDRRVGPYEILGIPRDATAEEVHRGHRRLVTGSAASA